MKNDILKQNKIEMTRRPPIVVVMGHIDHGKTKILDWYRKTKVVEEEAGGITQHIGAYEITHHDQKITFIDTPGHEAFSKIRSRGAKAADIAILVIAADEGLKPQTKEAIDIITENNLPFVVAINKIDKPEANPELVKKQLAEAGVLVESYGGKIPAVEISAKTGVNMDELLETILLLAELEELKANLAKPAEGVVIEAHLDPRRGITSSLLVLDGTLKKEQVLVIGKKMETIKIMEDFRGQTIREAGPSAPVLVAGFQQMPTIGDTFRAFKTRGEALQYLAALPPEEKETVKVKTPETSQSSPPAKPIFNIILKTDVAGSGEALAEALQKLESEEIGINIIRNESGDINESDVKMAQATKLVTIVGFKVKIEPAVQELAEKSNIRIINGEIIYEILDKIKEKLAEMHSREIKRIQLGRAKILKIFKKDNHRQIVGGRVEEGIIKRGARLEIKRAGESMGEGEIIQLQHKRRDTNEVTKGLEFGVMIDAETTIQEGDIIEIFEEAIKKN